MGRLARYKKIRSVDPYSKKNGGKVDLTTVGIWGISNNGQKNKKRSRRSEALRSSRGQKAGGKRNDAEFFNLPPEDDDDDFDMADLVGSVKKQQTPDDVLKKIDQKHESDIPSPTTRTAVPSKLAPSSITDKDEREAARLLKIGSKLKAIEKAKAEESHKRLPGESKRAFNKRTKVETRKIMLKEVTQTRNTEKIQKKKDFLKQKKKRRRKGGGQNNNDSSDDDDDYRHGNARSGKSDSADEVRFGEQAERPPVFKQLPRGTTKKQKTGQTSGSTTAAKNRELEEMRKRVQAQYATIKAKRKQDGDFHL